MLVAVILGSYFGKHHGRKSFPGYVFYQNLIKNVLKQIYSNILPALLRNSTQELRGFPKLQAKILIINILNTCVELLLILKSPFFI